MVLDQDSLVSIDAAVPASRLFNVIFTKKLDQMISYEQALLPYYAKLYDRFKLAGDSAQAIRQVQTDFKRCRIGEREAGEKIPLCSDQNEIPYSLDDYSVGNDWMSDDAGNRGVNGLELSRIGQLASLSAPFANLMKNQTKLKEVRIAVKDVSRLPFTFDQNECRDQAYGVLYDGPVVPTSVLLLIYDKQGTNPIRIVCEQPLTGGSKLNFDRASRTLTYSVAGYFNGGVGFSIYEILNTLKSAADSGN